MFFHIMALVQHNYLLFHVVIEGFAIIVAFLSYVLATRTYKYSCNNYLLFLGICFLYIGFFDFLHIITYKGMNLVPGATGTNLATQFWLVGRYLEAAGLLLATVFIKRKISVPGLYLGATAVSLGFLLSILYYKNFPAAFIEGQGLTAFKVYSEYVLCILIATAGIVLLHKKDVLGKSMTNLMLLVILCTIFSELSFTLYNDPYGVSNLVGHLFKLTAYYLLFIGIVKRSLDKPMEVIFNELRNTSLNDPLTGLYNRLGAMENMKQALARAERNNDSLGILIMDLDNFKTVNDLYGHATGDRVLKQFAGILRQELRESDLLCRLGGDEFMAIVNADTEGMELICQRIEDAVHRWAETELAAAHLGVSIGMAMSDSLNVNDPDCLIARADEHMYREKALHKGAVQSFPEAPVAAPQESVPQTLPAFG